MRKKLFAILMSAMMMVTFMPAMAFAVTTEYKLENVQWTGYTECTGDIVLYTTGDTSTTREVVLPGVKAELTKTWDATNNCVKVTASFAGHVAPLTTTGYDLKKYYYDLTGATLVYGDTAAKKSMDADDFMDCYSYNSRTLAVTFDATRYADGFKVVVPTYVENYAAEKTDNSLTVSFSNIETCGKADVTFAFPAYEPYEEATVTLVPTVKTKVNETAYWTGVPATQSLKITTIKGKTNLEKTELNLDGQKTSGSLTNYWNKDNAADTEGTATSAVEVNMPYDGAEHAFNVPTKGVKVEYKVKSINGVNVASPAYTETAPTLKDVASSKVFYVKVTKKGTLDIVKYLQVNATVTQANVTIGIQNGQIYQGETVDPYACIKVEGVNSTDKAAVKADAEAIKAVLKSVYTATATPSKDGSKIVVEATKKTLTDAEKLAFAKATANYNVSYTDLSYEMDGTLTVTTGTFVNEISFDGTIAKKTYKNKGTKLTKNHTIQVVANATSGVAPTFKLINANSKITIDKATGKITVKKGLKKGTYKFTVKAYGAAGNGYKATSETHEMTIKVAKK